MGAPAPGAKTQASTGVDLKFLIVNVKTGKWSMSLHLQRLCRPATLLCLARQGATRSRHLEGMSGRRVCFYILALP